MFLVFYASTKSFTFGRRKLIWTTNAITTTPAIKAKPEPKVPLSDDLPNNEVTNAPQPTPVIFRTP